MRNWLLLISLGLTGLLAHADDDKLEYFPDEVPKLEQARGFNSVRGDRWIVYGRAKNQGFFVIEIRGGETHFPVLVNDYPEGESLLTLTYKSGEILQVPYGRDAKPILEEAAPAGLIDPKKGRENLHEFMPTPLILKSLGVENRVASVFGTPAHTFTRVFPANANLVWIVFPVAPNKGEHDRAKALMTTLESEWMRFFFPYFNDRDKEPSEIILALPDIYVDEIRGRAGSEFGFESQVYPQLFPESVGDLRAPVKDEYPVDGFTRAARLRQWLGTPASLAPGAAAIISEQIVYLEQFRYFQLTFFDHIWANQAEGATLRREYERRFVEPLDHTLSAAFAKLNELQTPDAALSFLFSGGPLRRNLNVRLPLLPLMASAEKTYFHTWLEILQQHVAWSETASPIDWELHRRNGTVNGAFYGLHRTPLTYLTDRYPMTTDFPYFQPHEQLWPILLFGYHADPELRASLVRAILAMDASAQVAKAREFEERKAYDDREHVEGSLILTSLLSAMRFEPFREGKPPEGFSLGTYTIQMMEVLSELLNTSRWTIHNQATYLSLISTAAGVSRDAQARLPDYGNLPGYQGALLRLHEALQVRLLRALYSGHGRICEAGLLPQ